MNSVRFALQNFHFEAQDLRRHRRRPPIAVAACACRSGPLTMSARSRHAGVFRRGGSSSASRRPAQRTALAQGCAFGRAGGDWRRSSWARRWQRMTAHRSSRSRGEGRYARLQQERQGEGHGDSDREEKVALPHSPSAARKRLRRRIRGGRFRMVHKDLRANAEAVPDRERSTPKLQR